jgi:hypothetical protein
MSASGGDEFAWLNTESVGQQRNGRGRQQHREYASGLGNNQYRVIEVCSPAVNVPSAESNNNLIDLYSVGHEEVTRGMCNKGV